MWLETTAQVSDSIPPTQSLDHLMNYSPPACLLSCFSWVWFFVTLWTVAYQVPLSMGFSKQRYCSGLPCLTPGHLLDPGVEPVSPMSPALQVDSLLLSHQGSPQPSWLWEGGKSSSKFKYLNMWLFLLPTYISLKQLVKFAKWNKLFTSPLEYVCPLQIYGLHGNYSVPWKPWYLHVVKEGKVSWFVIIAVPLLSSEVVPGT